MASVRVILPPKFDEQALDKVLESEFKKYAPFLVKDFDKTTPRSTCWLRDTSGARRRCVRPSTRAAGNGRWTRCRRSPTIPRG